MTAKELARLIRIRCGGANYSLDEITDTYQTLCRYVGIDPHRPPVGLDLVEMALEKFGSEWIDVREIVPDHSDSSKYGGVWYWVTDGELYDVALYIQGHFLSGRELNVTHWRPIAKLLIPPAKL